VRRASCGSSQVQAALGIYAGKHRADATSQGGVYDNLATLPRFLDNAHICYAHTRHSIAFTALEVAFAEQLSPHKLAKTVVYVGARGYGLAVLPADCLIKLDTLGCFLNDPDIRLASELELGELSPECELGAMPLFGNLFHLPVLVETSVAEQELRAGPLEELASTVPAAVGRRRTVCWCCGQPDSSFGWGLSGLRSCLADRAIRPRLRVARNAAAAIDRGAQDR